MLLSQHGNHHSKRHSPQRRDATADTRSSRVSARPRLSWRCKLRASKIWTSEPAAQGWRGWAATVVVLEIIKSQGSTWSYQPD